MTAHIGARVRDMSVDDLAVALWRGARGVDEEEAAVGVIIGSGTWMDRPEFRAQVAVAVEGCPAPSAWVDWVQLAHNLTERRIVCSSGEAQVLRCACGLAGEGGWPLISYIDGLDAVHLPLVLDAMAHAVGCHERPDDEWLVDGYLADVVDEVAGRCSS